jgi:hypothetical protein
VSVPKVNLGEKFRQFDDQWSPKIAGEVSDSYVKLVKFQGDFVWHNTTTKTRCSSSSGDASRCGSATAVVEENEFVIVPKGIEHCPVAEEEAHVLLFEPKTTLNTGDVVNERTIEKLDRI